MNGEQCAPSCEVIAHHVGGVVKAYRLKSGLTQDLVASKVGLKCGSSIAKIESGAQPASFDMVIKLALILHIDPTDFFRGLIFADDVDGTGDEPPLTTGALVTLLSPLADPGVRKALSKYVDRLEHPSVISVIKLLLAPEDVHS